MSVSREHRILLRPEFVKQRQHRDRLHAACDTRNLLYTGHCSCRCLKAYKLILHVGIHESSHTYYCSDSKHSTSWLGTKWYQQLQTQHQINCCLKTFTTRWDFFVKILLIASCDKTSPLIMCIDRLGAVSEFSRILLIVPTSPGHNPNATMGSCRRVEPFSCHQRCQVPLSPTHSSLKGTDPPRWLYGLRRLHASGPALPIPSGTAGDHCHILSYPINMSLCENLKLSK